MAYIELYDNNGNTYYLEDSYYGSSDPTPKGFWKTLSINVGFIIWCLLLALLPLVFCLLIAPSHEQFIDALIEGGALVVLWIFAIVNVAINVKRKIFLHKLRHSNEDKFVQIRRQLDGSLQADDQSVNETDKTDEYQAKERFFIREIKHPLVKTMKHFRVSLIGIFLATILLSVVFPSSDITGYATMFLGPMFAYSYIFDIVSGYVIYGKKGNWVWLGFVVAVVVSYFFMGFEALEKVAEYLLFICLTAANHLVFSKLEKSQN